MAVLLPNALLGLRRRVEGAVNAHGERVAAGWGEFLGPHEGRVSEGADASWSLGLDPSLWPVRVGDLVVATSGAGAWLVQTADLLRNNYDPTVDWIRVSGLRRTGSGTAPADVWSVARYVDTVDPAVADYTVPAYEGGRWLGTGTPPAPGGTFTPAAGDEYLDLNTGIVYTLGGAA